MINLLLLLILLKYILCILTILVDNVFYIYLFNVRIYLPI